MSIGYQVDQAVATLTLNRPEKKNALTAAMYQALAAHLKQAAGAQAARAVTITGAGNAFTGGNDLKDFGAPRFIQPDCRGSGQDPQRKECRLPALRQGGRAGGDHHHLRHAQCPARGHGCGHAEFPHRALDPE